MICFFKIAGPPTAGGWSLLATSKRNDLGNTFWFRHSMIQTCLTYSFCFNIQPCLHILDVVYIYQWLPLFGTNTRLLSHQLYSDENWSLGSLMKMNLKTEPHTTLKIYFCVKSIFWFLPLWSDICTRYLFYTVVRIWK